MGIISKCYYAVKSQCQISIKKLKCRNLHCGRLPYFTGKVDFTFRNNSVVFLGNNLRLGDGVSIAVRDKGKLTIKDDVRINIDTVIWCHDSISIGAYTQIGPFCQIYDHDHIFSSVEAFDNQEFLTTPVEIGEHCWIGANCIILRGTKIGKNCVVAAGTVLKGNYPDNSMIYNKRETIVKQIVRDS